MGVREIVEAPVRVGLELALNRQPLRPTFQWPEFNPKLPSNFSRKYLTLYLLQVLVNIFSNEQEEKKTDMLSIKHYIPLCPLSWLLSLQGKPNVSIQGPVRDIFPAHMHAH